MPSFYHNRPQNFIEHVSEGMAAVDDFNADQVVMNSTENGEFIVNSTHSDVEYKVNFGNDNVRVPYRPF